jgi:hypothetical protein
VYIYSHLEPFFCHRFFPCFDQPSVKAPLKLSVISPKQEWKVIGNSLERAFAVDCKSDLFKSLVKMTGFEDMLLEAAFQEKGFYWEFAPSVKCSSYIYAMCAGEYEQIDCKISDAIT